MSRPTLGLMMIVKNEKHNLPALFESIKDCVDQIYIADTGSDDGTVEYLEELKQVGNAPIHVHHFQWIQDFSAARNFIFDKVKTDYALWLDGDDLLENKEAFLKWRDHAMELSDFWLNPYFYGSDNGGKPVCTFLRERVLKVDRGFRWNYFLHEGIVPKSPHFADIKINQISTWNIKHKRTQDEMVGDRGRNLAIMEKHKDKLDARMKYYLAKEHFDAGDPVSCIRWGMEAVADPKLEPHDRVLGLQYVSYAYMSCNQFEKAIQVAHQGLQLDANRAEFYVCIGDSYLKLGQAMKAIPAFHAAKSCTFQINGSAGMIFISEACYTSYPREQLSRIYANFGQLDLAISNAEEAITMGGKDAVQILQEVSKIKHLSDVRPVEAVERCDDIVISCPPGTQLYDWDFDIAKEKGIGGSETAAVQMAHWLHKLTKRPVKVFNTRANTKICDGVEYIPSNQINEYFTKYAPKLHIAWRHTLQLTKAKTVVWSHDLITPGIGQLSDNQTLMCLSPFHANYAMAMQGVREDKIWITRNGIDPDRFLNKEISKIKGKVMFPSSPDRGLDQALQIMDLVVKEIPEATLHVFYGTDNMRKMGMIAQAEKIEAQLKEKSYVKYHGNVQQDELAKHFLEAECWLYPASFIETFGIVALEAMAGKAYPVATRIGALQNTVGQFADLGMADLFDERAETLATQQKYAKAVVDAIRESKWQKIDYPLEKISWRSVANDWINHFGLNTPEE